MNRDQAQLLLGGYATGTLTEAERKLLFEASLDDQQLFDALADEEALRELLADPEARRRLAAVLARPRADERESPMVGWLAWLWRPIPVAALAVFAISVIGVGILLQRQNAEFQMAKVKTMQEGSPAFGLERESSPAPLRNESPAGAAGAGGGERRPAAGRSNPAPAGPGRQEAKETVVADPPAAELSASSRRDAPSADSAPSAAAPAPAPPGIVIGPESEPASSEMPALEGVMALSKKAEAAPAKPAAQPPPFRYWIERRRADGTWTEYGAELSVGDEVRLRVLASQAGYLAVGGTGSQLVEVKPGGTYYIPAPKATAAGERTLLLSLLDRVPTAAAPGASLMRLRQAAPVGRAARKETDEKRAAKADGERGGLADMATPAVIHRVQVRLQYR
ncbi:MAG: hypothetical protein R2762_08975 [Bryobacteraceae bacterium]